MNVLASIRGANLAPYPGWLSHDGQGLPVAPSSQPGVAFRNGWRVPPAQYAASHWLDFGRDFWSHVGGPLDIVAFLPSYRTPASARSRSAVCTMISERFGHAAGDAINQQLADDIIALLTTRSISEGHDPSLSLGDLFPCAK